MTIFIALFEQADGDQYLIEYQPRYSEKDGCVLIEIASVTHTRRPTSWEEQRSEHQQQPLPRRAPRQLEFDEQAPEHMSPYAGREA